MTKSILRQVLMAFAITISLCFLIGASVSVAADGAVVTGKIVVNHDEWTLGDPGFDQADAEAFALSLANWFTGGELGTFLVYSDDQYFDPEVHGGSLKNAMETAGHTWIISDGSPIIVENWLANYDAVFLAGPFPETSTAPDNQLLIEYVEAGGNIYLAGGTGDFGGASYEAAAWNTFLNHFNLNFGDSYGVYGVFPIASTDHPIFQGVTALYYVNGNPVSVIDPDSPNTVILESKDSHGLIGVFAVVEIEVTIDIKPGSFPNSINLSSAGVIPVAILSSATFDATTVDPDTISLAGARIKMVGKSGKYLAHEEDINGDGLIDLVCQVETAQFMIEVGESVAVLEAETYEGILIRGEDTVRIVPDN